MKNNPLSRYKLKAARKRTPKIRLDFSSDAAVPAFSDNRRGILEELTAELYDEVWPQWRCHAVIQISVRFLTLDHMAQLNDEYRQTDEPTDVLTFSLFERDGRFIPEPMPVPLLLGEVFLCPDVIAKNAAEHDIPVLSEAAFVFFHGMLHLLAWDHDTPERQAVMWRVQERFRDRFLARVSEDKATG